MPRCNHPEATCAIGDFWTCKTAGCPNGPAEAAAAPVAASTPPDGVLVAIYTYPDGSRQGLYQTASGLRYWVTLDPGPQQPPDDIQFTISWSAP
jgi:hypothetical protein